MKDWDPLRRITHHSRLQIRPSYQRLGEPAYMDEKKALVIQYVQTHPAEFLRRTWMRIISFWTVPQGVGMWLVSVGAFIGLGLAIKKLRAKVMPLAIPMIFFPLVYYLVWAFPRHRHPIEPAILLLFAYAVDQLILQVSLAKQTSHA